MIRYRYYDVIRPGLAKQYEYIQLQQEQRINWSRTFTIEQQLRYGVTPSGEPLDLTTLRHLNSGQVQVCVVDIYCARLARQVNVGVMTGNIAAEQETLYHYNYYN